MIYHDNEIDTNNSFAKNTNKNGSFKSNLSKYNVKNQQIINITDVSNGNEKFLVKTNVYNKNQSALQSENRLFNNFNKSFPENFQNWPITMQQSFIRSNNKSKEEEYVLTTSNNTGFLNNSSNNRNIDKQDKNNFLYNKFNKKLNHENKNDKSKYYFEFEEKSNKQTLQYGNKIINNSEKMNNTQHLNGMKNTFNENILNYYTSTESGIISDDLETNNYLNDTPGGLNIMIILITIEFIFLAILLHILYKVWKWNRREESTTHDINIPLNSNIKVMKNYNTHSPGYKRYSLSDGDFSDIRINVSDEAKHDFESDYISYQRYNSIESENNGCMHYKHYCSILNENSLNFVNDKLENNDDPEITNNEDFHTRSQFIGHTPMYETANIENVKARNKRRTGNSVAERKKKGTTINSIDSFTNDDMNNEENNK